MATVLEEMGVLVRTRPGPDATDAEVAAWYWRKAAMLRHIAADGRGSQADQAERWAALAVAHANALIGGIPAQSKAFATRRELLGEVA